MEPVVSLKYPIDSSPTTFVVWLDVVNSISYLARHDLFKFHKRPTEALVPILQLLNVPPGVEKQ